MLNLHNSLLPLSQQEDIKTRMAKQSHHDPDSSYEEGFYKIYLETVITATNESMRVTTIDSRDYHTK